MEFIEVISFIKSKEGLLDEDELLELQKSLLLKPAQGDVIPKGKGLRKMRWKGSGRGKRGGIRVIYYWVKEDEVIFLLIAYAKNKKDDLTSDQLKLLMTLI